MASLRSNLVGRQLIKKKYMKEPISNHLFQEILIGFEDRLYVQSVLIFGSQTVFPHQRLECSSSIAWNQQGWVDFNIHERFS